MPLSIAAIVMGINNFHVLAEDILKLHCCGFSHTKICCSVNLTYRFHILAEGINIWSSCGLTGNKISCILNGDILTTEKSLTIGKCGLTGTKFCCTCDGVIQYYHTAWGHPFSRCTYFALKFAAPLMELHSVYLLIEHIPAIGSRCLTGTEVCCTADKDG
jgi:hypothetical protein